MNMAELLRLGEEELQRAGVEEFQLDARLLLQYCTGKSRTEIFLDSRSTVGVELEETYRALLDRRKDREPLAYIVGEREFWSLVFHVSPDVLIPRPETEFLVDRVLNLTDPENFSRGNILDLCCGSGVIAAVLAHETGQKVIAADISAAALAVARKNILTHNLRDLVLFVQASLLSAFRDCHQFSLVVSNPPYVSRDELAVNLAPEVSHHEPHLALDGGERGMEVIVRIRRALPTVLTGGAQCFLEIGADQGHEVLELFRHEIVGQKNFQQVEILQDYAGRDRVVHARLAK